jgi:hypothetical protein
MVLAIIPHVRVNLKGLQASNCQKRTVSVITQGRKEELILSEGKF